LELEFLLVDLIEGARLVVGREELVEIEELDLRL